jgi:hypothetical protein
MNGINQRTWFLALCVELYKQAKGLTGGEAWTLLAETGAAEYVTDCADALHTTGPLYIVESIDGYMNAHGHPAPASVG